MGKSLIICRLTEMGIILPQNTSNKRASKRSKKARLSSRTGSVDKTKSQRRVRAADARKPAKSANKSKSSAAKFPNKPYFVEVDAEHDGQRVDNFLVTHLKGVPKSLIYRIIRKGEVRVNKGRIKQTTRLNEGDSIRIPPIRLSEQKDQSVDAARYQFLNDAVLFEDDALLIINKPSGLAVHAGSGVRVGVIEALRAVRTDIRYLELVHRLDRETSGCLVLAKKSSALKKLHEDFKSNSLKNKRLDKRYLALVKGRFKSGERKIVKPLNTDARRGGERYVIVDEGGSYASSIAKPLTANNEASLIEVKLLTGRTHQVRVHTQSEGHPIAGDSKYGDREFNQVMKSKGLSRLFLHAYQLTLFHPVTEAKISIEAPLPEDLNTVLKELDLCIN